MSEVGTAESLDAGRTGRLWGARAGDWIANEERERPGFEEALDRLAVGPGDEVLDVGCGGGVFLRLAADRGARVHGLDAAAGMVALARERTPDADVRIGHMEALPWEDDAFDFVTGFTSFFFAEDMIGALREAARVTKPSGAVLAEVWGRPERCDLAAMREAIAPLGPPPPADAEEPPPLWKAGVLEDMMRSAGLEPVDAYELTYAFEYPDRERMLAAIMAPGPVVAAIERSGEAAVRDALVAALERFRTPAGGYSFTNEWRFVIARA